MSLPVAYSSIEREISIFYIWTERKSNWAIKNSCLNDLTIMKLENLRSLLQKISVNKCCGDSKIEEKTKMDYKISYNNLFLTLHLSAQIVPI